MRENLLMEAWEFEGYWYVQSPSSLPLCMNSGEAVEYLRELEAVADAAQAYIGQLIELGPIISKAGKVLADALDALKKFREKRL